MATSSPPRRSLVEATAAAAGLTVADVRAKGFSRLSEVDAVLATLPPSAPPPPASAIAARARAPRADEEGTCPVCLHDLRDGETSAELGGVVDLPCGHALHAACLLGWCASAMGDVCPLCRAGLPARMIACVRPSAPAAAAAAPHQLRLCVGNTYDRVPYHPTRWRWTLFLRAAADAPAPTAADPADPARAGEREPAPPRPAPRLSDYVERVRFRLWTTSHVARAPPFEVSRAGRSAYDVDVTIVWRAALALPPTVVSHHLALDPLGAQREFAVGFGARPPPRAPPPPARKSRPPSAKRKKRAPPHRVAPAPT